MVLNKSSKLPLTIRLLIYYIDVHREVPRMFFRFSTYFTYNDIFKEKKVKMCFEMLNKMFVRGTLLFLWGT